MAIQRMFKQAVTLETYLGSGAHGPLFASPLSVPCAISSATKMVRNTLGEEVVSSTRIYAAVTTAPTEPAVAGQFSPGSRVTIAGKVAHVIAAASRDQPAPTRVHHVEVDLT
jgi:hypothetical protein